MWTLTVGHNLLLRRIDLPVRIARGVPFGLLLFVFVRTELRFLGRVIVWLPATPPAQILSIEQAGESLRRLPRLRRGGSAKSQGKHGDDESSVMSSIHLDPRERRGIVAYF